MEHTTKRCNRRTTPRSQSHRRSAQRFAWTDWLDQRPPARLVPACPPASAGGSATDPVTAVPVWKRSLDIGLIMIVLPLILVFALVVYCWIKAASPGQVLFRQTRIGRGGKPFTIYKFRSMQPHASTIPHELHTEHLIKSGGPMTKLDLVGDPRLIKGGCLIRMSGLDELPQLFNVLRGEMSLVGPRPCMPNEFELYGSDQKRRFSLRPGLTGLWQIRRTASTTFREMVAMDDDYARKLSLWLDLKIVAGTPAVLFRQIGRCRRMKVPKKTAKFTPAPQPNCIRMAPPATFAKRMGAITQNLNRMGTITQKLG